MFSVHMVHVYATRDLPQALRSGLGREEVGPPATRLEASDRTGGSEPPPAEQIQYAIGWTPTGPKTPMCQAHDVIERFRELDEASMDITHEMKIKDKHGNALAFDWRRYIYAVTKGHGNANAVGAGITRFCVELLRDIKDHNTKPTCRVDFVVYQAGGRVVRIHPRKSMQTDDYLYVDPPHVNLPFASHLARRQPDHEGGLAAGAPLGSSVLCTMAGLAGLADGIGRPEARAFLLDLDRDKDFVDLCNGHLFSWPRFLGNIRQRAAQERIVGSGITRFEARALPGTTSVPVFVVTRSDNSMLALWPGSNSMGVARLTCTAGEYHFDEGGKAIIDGVEAALNAPPKQPAATP